MDSEIPSSCAFTAVAPIVRFSAFEIFATPTFFLASDFISRTGVISGTPSASGSFASIQVSVADSASHTANCGAAFTLVISPSGGGPSFAYPVTAGLMISDGSGTTNTLTGNLGTGTHFVVLAVAFQANNAAIGTITINGSDPFTLIKDDGDGKVTLYGGTATLTGTDSIVITSAAGAFDFLDMLVAPWVLSNLHSTTVIPTPQGGEAVSFAHAASFGR
jgi:hypothetical protein